jgi:C4-dicarboxylate-binding protein DctP
MTLKTWLPVAAAAIVCLAGGPATAQSFTMKLAGATMNEPSHDYLKLYKEKIEARTGGRIKGEVYPGAQLGGFPRMIESVQLGTLELYTGPPGFLRGIDPRVQVLDAPGLFDSFEHAQKTLTDPRFREQFLNLTAAKGLTGATLYMYGPTGYPTLSPVRKLEDFRGKKFRVLATKVEIAVMAQVGATGVPIDMAEVLPALQNKVIDGVRSNIAVTGAQKFFTIAKYITNVKDSWIALAGYASTVWLDKLPADLRKTVLDVGKELDDETYKLAVEFDKGAVKLWQDNGAEVIELPAADQAEFMRRARAVAEEILGGDPALKDFYTLFREVADSHRKKG